MDDTDSIKVTQLLDLTAQGIRVSDVTFARVRVTSDQWLCVLSRKERASKDGFVNHAVVIDPKTNQVCSFEMEGLISAQVNPIKSVVALTSNEKIFVVDIKSHECIAWNRFPCRVEFWTWLSKNVVGIIGPDSVYHWNIDTDQLTFMFERHLRLSGNQISGYSADSKLSWFVIRSLFMEDDSSIGGMLQVFSSDYGHTTCIEGHAATIIDHKFLGRDCFSNFLIFVKKVTPKLAKLAVTELGPRNKTSSQPMISRMESFPWTNEEDIPSFVVCSTALGLVYLLSKLGSLFIFDLETCSPIILDERICHDIIFQSVLHQPTQGVMVMCRTGHVLLIEGSSDLKSKCLPSSKVNGSPVKTSISSEGLLLSTSGQVHDKDDESAGSEENEVTRL